MLAALTSRRSLVQIQPGLLDTPVAQRQRQLSYKERNAGSSPAGGTELRSGLEPGCQHGLISRPTPVRIRPPQLDGLEVLRQHTTLVSVEGRVRFPAGPLNILGCCQEEDAAVARRRSGCDSPAVH